MNKVILTGRITAEPEIKMTENKTKFSRFNLAVQRKYKNADGERQTDFIPCTAWQQTADLIYQFIKKGDLFTIEGAIQTGCYENKEGVMVYTTDVAVESIEFIPNGKGKEELNPLPFDTEKAKPSKQVYNSYKKR